MSQTSKMATESWYFLPFNALTWQISTVEVKKKGIQIRCVTQKCSIKQDIELPVATYDVPDVS